MPAFNPNDYDTVESRLKKFWADHPEGAVLTDVVGYTPDHKSVIIKASVYFNKTDPIPTGVGVAQDQLDTSGRGANSTNWVENADTSAVGRALANCNYSGNKRASREEMAKTERSYGAPQGQPPRRDTPSAPPAQQQRPSSGGEIQECRKCGKPIRFIMENGKPERYHADGSLHFRECGKGTPTGYEPQGGGNQTEDEDPFRD